MRKKKAVLGIALLSLLGALFPATVNAASQTMPSSVSLTTYVKGKAVSKDKLTYSYNPLGLVSKGKHQEWYRYEGKWRRHTWKFSPEYEFYADGSLKHSWDGLPWFSDSGGVSYDKKGYITERSTGSYDCTYTYQKGWLSGVQSIIMSSERYSEALLVKYTRYGNKKVKTMRADLVDSVRNPTLYKLTFNKSGFLTKIKDFGTYTVKYTMKNNRVTQMKVLVNGKKYRIWKFGYKQQKGSPRQYRSMINVFAGSSYGRGESLDRSDLEVVEYLNLDNGYRNVF